MLRRIFLNKNKIVISDRSVLTKTKGFWSKKEVLINNTSNLVLLKEQATTADAISSIKNYIDANMRNEVHEKLTSLLSLFREREDKDTTKFEKASGLVLRDIPALTKADWTAKGHTGEDIFSVTAMLNHAKADGKFNPDETANIIEKAWFEHYEGRYWTGVSTCHLSSGITLMVTDWDKLKSLSLTDLILQLYDLITIDIKARRFDSNIRTYHSSSRKRSKTIKVMGRNSSGKFLKKHLPEQEISLFQRFSGKHLGEVPDIYFYHWLLNIKRMAVHALTILKSEGYCLWPVDDQSDQLLTDVFDKFFSQPIYGMNMVSKYAPSDAEVKKTLTKLFRKFLRHLYLSSTLNGIEDFPVGIRNSFNFINTKGRAGWRLLYTHLLAYANTNGLEPYPHDDMLKNRVQKDQIDVEYSVEWCEANLPEEWQLFCRIYREFNSAGEEKQRDVIASYIRWAWETRKFQSPRDVKGCDIRNPFMAGELTYFDYVKGMNNIEQTKQERWSSTKSMCDCVWNASKLDGSIFHGQLETPFPFGLADNPFRGKSRDKTHRARIHTAVLNMMLDIHLEPDENGMPYKFARRAFPKDFISVPDPQNPGRIVKAWNETRASSVAMHLLTPLRTVQIRWLDQGLMDEYIYDTKTGEMIENTHPLRNFKYENGKTHLEQYGRPSGILQYDDDPFSHKKELGIFISTNKTAMWRKDGKKSGYYIPWPTGEDLMAHDDPAIRDAGKWLNRVYKVITWQLEFVQTYDPNPHPLSFYNSNADKMRVNFKDYIQTEMPMFVPLFRDMTMPCTSQYNGAEFQSYGPLTDMKMSAMFSAVAVEAERRFREQGINVTLTKEAGVKAKTGGGSAGTYQGRRCIYDPHTLRVASISQLLDDGVPLAVVQAMAGHSGYAMTVYYWKHLNASMREIMIQMAQRLNTDPNLNLDAMLDKIRNGNLSMGKIFVFNERAGATVSEESEDLTDFPLVEGGICRMGGKGSMCHAGQRYFDKDGKEQYGQVKSGCGNCRFFATSYLFSMEHTVYFHHLQYTIKKLGQKRRKKYEQQTKLAEDSSQCKDGTKLHKFQMESMQLSADILDYTERMNAMLAELTNRYELIKACDQLLAEQVDEDDKTPMITGPFDQDHFDLSQLHPTQHMTVMEETTDFGLVRRIAETTRFCSRRVICPDEVADDLQRYMDIILESEGLEYRIFPIRDREDRINLSSMLANFLSELAGDEELQRVIDERGRLQISEADRRRLEEIHKIFERNAEGRQLNDNTVQLQSNKNLDAIEEGRN